MHPTIESPRFQLRITVNFPSGKKQNCMQYRLPTVNLSSTTIAAVHQNISPPSIEAVASNQPRSCGFRSTDSGKRCWGGSSNSKPLRYHQFLGAFRGAFGSGLSGRIVRAASRSPFPKSFKERAHYLKLMVKLALRLFGWQESKRSGNRIPRLIMVWASLLLKCFWT